MRARLQILLRRLANPGIYVGALFAVMVIVATYQIRPRYDIPIGTPTDGPMLRGFNAAERMQDSEQTFRWTGEDSYIDFESIGAQDLAVVLTISGSRPAGQPAPYLRIQVDGDSVWEGEPSPALQDYSFTIPREKMPGGTASIHLLVNGFSPPGDSRILGVVVTHVRGSPGPHVDLFIAPPLSVLIWLMVAVGLFGLVLALLGWGTGGVLAGTVLISLLIGGLLISDRLWLTSDAWYDIWPQAVAAAGIFTLLVGLVGGWFLRKGAASQGSGNVFGLHFRVLLTLLFVVFAVRLAGQLHPQIFIVDLFYHVHRFEDAANGKLIYMHVASELAGRDTFYLMTAYIFMMPLQWLIADIPLTVRLFTIGLGTAGGFILYYLCARVLSSTRAGLIAATLYLTMPLAVLVYSWGITTNVFAEFVVLLTFTVFVVARDLHPRRPAFWALAVLLFVGVLSHPAVVQIFGFAVALLCLFWFIRGGPGFTGLRTRSLQVVGAGVLAVIAAYLAYYRNVIPTMLATLAEIGSSRNDNPPATGDGIRVLIGGAVKDRYLGLVIREVYTYAEWFWGGLQGLWQEFWVYFQTWPLVGSFLGYISLRNRGRSDPVEDAAVSRLKTAAIAWMIAAIVFAGVGWGLNLYVRYSLFILPVVSLGCGILLSRLWDRGRAGRLLSLFLLLFFVLGALFLWQFRINYGLK